MPTELAELSTSLPADRHPVATLLARLAPGSRRSIKTALETIAELLSGVSAGDRIVVTLDRAEVEAGALVSEEDEEGT